MLLKQDSSTTKKENNRIAHLLEVQGLKTYFHLGKNTVAKAVDGVNFSVKRGETVALVGESGSGKSVTSLSIMGLIPHPGKIIAGSIRLKGKELVGRSQKEMNEIRGKEIGMIFQEPMTSLDPVFTIGYQITESILKHKKLRKKEAKKEAIHLLKMVGFARAEEMLDAYPHELSGGMRQRVMIAIAMACKPALLIADEPTTALDVTIQAQILDVMKDLKETFDTSILLITHDLGVVAEVADRVLVMYGGQVVEEATVKELFLHPKHPYTKGLLKSIPKLEDNLDRLESIPGSVPAAHRYPKGCRFADRCAFAMDICHQNSPVITQISNEHTVCCHLYRGGLDDA